MRRRKALPGLSAAACLILTSCLQPAAPELDGVERLFTDRDFRSAGDHNNRRWATGAPIPSRLTHRLTLPRDAELSWSHAARSPRRAKRVEVSVAVEHDGARTVVYETFLHSFGDTIRSWQEATVDLSDWADRTVDIVFEVRYEGGTTATDVGDRDSSGRIYWASPYVETPDPTERTSVIVVLLDTLRADRLGVLGAERPLTPNIDALASRGTLFTNTFSQANWTLPSTSSLFTGQYPLTHGVQQKRQKLKAGENNIARLFARHGYATAAFHDGGYLHSRFGFADGFDQYSRSRQLKALPRIATWLESHRHLPFFLLLHTYAVHSPYNSVPRDYWSLYADESKLNEIGRAPGPGRGKLVRGRPEMPLNPDEFDFLSDLYDGEVRYVDDRIAALLAELERLEITDNTILVLTSDHGEEFGEHGRHAHNGPSLHDELVSIPLLLVGPGIPAGRRIDEIVELVDLLPTLAEMTGLTGLEDTHLDGESLADLIAERRSERRNFAWSEKFERRAIRSDRWTLIAPGDGTFQLFDRQNDPGETTDVADQHPEVVDQLSSRMRDIVARSHGIESLAEPTEIDEQILKELRALGYVD